MKALVRAQIVLVKFLLRYGYRWHTVPDTQPATEVINSCVGLYLIRISKGGQIKLNSVPKAKRFLEEHIQ